MEAQIAPSLVYYGPLGLLCLILLYGVVALWRAKGDLQKAKDEQAKEHNCDAHPAKALGKGPT